MAALRGCSMVRPRSFVGLLLLVLGSPLSQAQSSHGGYSHHNSGYVNPSAGFHHNPSQGFHNDIGRGFQPSGGFNGIYYNPGIYAGYGVGGSYLYSPPLLVVGGGGGFLGPAFPQGVAPFAGGGMGMNMGNGMGGGLNLPMPPAGLIDPARPRARAANPAKSKELTEIGDRSFRGHNIKRAEEKYNLALKADPTAPSPHVHLAQVSIARGKYSVAADQIRDAITVAPDGAWLANAPDIQAMFGEPADFARHLGKLETHLQANPNDRDAWFVLGAENYLSGRTRQAFDLFQRLTDRRPDEALSVFLDASRPRGGN